MAGEAAGKVGVLPGVAAGAQILGTGVSAYGAYQQAKQAQAQYRMAVQAWEAEQRRQGRLDANAEQQQAISNGLSVGGYAARQAQEIEDPYIAYARSLGLGG